MERGGQTEREREMSFGNRINGEGGGEGGLHNGTTLFTITKHNMRIFGIIPFSKLQKKINRIYVFGSCFRTLAVMLVSDFSLPMLKQSRAWQGGGIQGPKTCQKSAISELMGLSRFGYRIPLKQMMMMMMMIALYSAILRSRADWLRLHVILHE